MVVFRRFFVSFFGCRTHEDEPSVHLASSRRRQNRFSGAVRLTLGKPQVHVEPETFVPTGGHGCCCCST